jgi:hypothetical protein
MVIKCIVIDFVATKPFLTFSGGEKVDMTKEET